MVKKKPYLHTAFVMYSLLRVLVLNFTNTHQTENMRRFSEVGENKQLLIAIVGNWLF